MFKERPLVREKFISTREIAFFGLQGIIPVVFALIPPFVFVVGIKRLAPALERLTDGTLILIAFTMLISLSQDLQQAVRPYQRKFVARLELLLRICAITILGTYALVQAVAMLMTADHLHLSDQASTAAKQIIDATDAPAAVEAAKNFRQIQSDASGDAAKIEMGNHWVEGALTILSGLCLVLASWLTGKIFWTLRPHFVDSE